VLLRRITIFGDAISDEFFIKIHNSSLVHLQIEAQKAYWAGNLGASISSNKQVSLEVNFDYICDNAHTLQSDSQIEKDPLCRPYSYTNFNFSLPLTYMAPIEPYTKGLYIYNLEDSTIIGLMYGDFDKQNNSTETISDQPGYTQDRIYFFGTFFDERSLIKGVFFSENQNGKETGLF